MAAVMSDSPGAAYRQLANIVEQVFQEKTRFAMTEDAVRILFAELLRRFADSAEKGDLLQKIEHFLEHGSEFLQMMLEHIPKDELDHLKASGRRLIITADHVKGLVSEISNRWFPDGPTGDQRPRGPRR